MVFHDRGACRHGKYLQAEQADKSGARRMRRRR
jgi:hypothetical protein